MSETSGTITRDEVVRWLRAEADSYTQDQHRLISSGDPKLQALADGYGASVRALNDAALRFADHGPLPRIGGRWYQHPMSGAARCHPWPEGCGERARYAAQSGRGEVWLRHREGCATKAALDADLAAERAEAEREEAAGHG